VEVCAGTAHKNALSKKLIQNFFVMLMQHHLIDSFLFNDYANKKMLKKIIELPEKENCVKFFSHIINSQNKWMARILRQNHAPQMSWWDPVYPLEQLEKQWSESLQAWIDFLNNKTEEQIFSDVEFIGYDGAKWKARLFDIALQLNYHSIHHRAQMQMLIRQQGIEPDFIDYIGTKYQKIS
jgi:uncharacterized damage-inducible protein DinB